MSNQSSNTQAFYIMSWISFVLSFGGGLIGVWYVDASVEFKAFLTMAFLFAVSSCFTLAKVVRDKHEDEKDEFGRQRRSFDKE